MSSYDPRTHRNPEQKLIMKITLDDASEYNLHVSKDQPVPNELHAHDRAGNAVVLDARRIRLVSVHFDFGQENDLRDQHG